MKQTYLQRKADNYLLDYYKNTSRALLVTGARQIGKTFAIRQLGKHFKYFVEINFVDKPELIDVFRETRGVEDILLRLSSFANQPLEKGQTLIFFDEVQCCPEIVTAIKFLVDEGSYRYVLSGSLLGVALKDLRSQPVGYMGIYEMYPLDFREFTDALGTPANVWEAIEKAWQERTEVDSFVHQRMMQAWRLYMIIGGMPAAVMAYLQTNNMQYVTKAQHDILNLYRQDIAQYDKNNKLQIQEIFNLIPPELNAKNKRFILKNLNETRKFNVMEAGFIWLHNAGVALPTYNVEEPKMPLLLARSRNLFKLFQNDIGLLACQYTNGIQLRLIQGDSTINYGAPYENVVAQELHAHGFPLYFYNNKKNGEVDFVVEYQGRVLPIEVKSGKDYMRHRALNNIMDVADYDLQEALVLTNDNMRVEGKIVYAPIYMLACLQPRAEEPLIYEFRW